MAKSKVACNKTLACGHECYGILNEQKCLPCLHQDCQKLMKSDQKGDDYCNICFVEGLNQAPCIQTLCKHVEMILIYYLDISLSLYDEESRN